MKFLLETSIRTFNRYSFQPDFTYFSRGQNLMGDINPSIFQFHRAILYAPAYMMISWQEKFHVKWPSDEKKKKKKEKDIIVPEKLVTSYLRSKNY